MMAAEIVLNVSNVEDRARRADSNEIYMSEAILSHLDENFNKRDPSQMGEFG